MFTLTQPSNRKRSMAALLIGLLAAVAVALAAPIAHADIRYADGYTWSTGARCDAAYRTLSVQSLTGLPSGQAYMMVWVYDYNTGKYIYQSNWLSPNSWNLLQRRATYSPMVRAAVYVKYARWTGSGWTYTGEWVADFSQDDVYSTTCTF